MYLGTNATPQERIERGECYEVWPAVEELIEGTHELRELEHQLEQMGDRLYAAKELLNAISEAVENKPRLRKPFNQLVENTDYEF